MMYNGPLVLSLTINACMSTKMNLSIKMGKNGKTRNKIEK